jgi:hypothetical protein
MEIGVAPQALIPKSFSQLEKGEIAFTGANDFLSL